MATQGLPLNTGGPDANQRVGNVLMLYLADPDRDERQAAEAAARAYREAGGQVNYLSQDEPQQDAAEETPKARKGGRPKKQKPEPMQTSAQALPSVVVLFPEISIDRAERERSQVALEVWLRLTKRQPLAQQWRAKMAAIGAKGFQHPDELLAEHSGRAEMERRSRQAAAMNEELKRQEAEETTRQAQTPQGEAQDEDEPAQGAADAQPNGVIEDGAPNSRVAVSAEDLKTLGLESLVTGNDIRKAE